MDVVTPSAVFYNGNDIYKKVNTYMGRPPGRTQDRIFQMRASEDFLSAIDRWRRMQSDEPSRAEAIRRLVKQALALIPKKGRRSN